MKSDRAKAIEEAAHYFADLHVFAAVVAIMESSILSSASQRAEFHLVKYCQNEIQRCQRAYERSSAKAAKSPDHAPEKMT